MNVQRVRRALNDLCHAAAQLASVCDRELPEYASVWHRIASNAGALQQENTREDLDAFVNGALSMFAYHPGSFSEAYVKRSDLTEQTTANEHFEDLKAQVSKVLVELRSAAAE